MRDFNRGGNSGGRSFDRGGNRGGGSFGGGSRGGYNDRGGSRSGGFGGDREMFQATCDSCGKSCELPFKPNGSKPVYCSDCFKKQDSGSDRRSGGFDRGGDRRSDSRPSRDFSAPRPSNGPDLSGLNAKLDKIIELLSANSPKSTPKQKKEVIKEVLAEEVLVTPDEKIMASEIVPEAVEIMEQAEAAKPKRKSKKAATPETTSEVPTQEATE